MYSEYPIVLHREVKKFLRNLPSKNKSQILTKLLSLGEDPFPNDYKHLSQNKGFYRVSQGEYRIIYRIINDLIQIHRVGKRNDDSVYRNI